MIRLLFRVFCGEMNKTKGRGGVWCKDLWYLRMLHYDSVVLMDTPPC